MWNLGLNKTVSWVRKGMSMNKERDKFIGVELKAIVFVQ